MRFPTRVFSAPQSSIIRHSPRRLFAQHSDIRIEFVRAKPEQTNSAFKQNSNNNTTPTKLNTNRAAGSESDLDPNKMTERNVLQQPLQLHSTSPLTGFLRNGYCSAPKSDFGNHSVAGILTDEFLDFSAAKGNDLRSAGLKGGCKWCLCVSRWKEAFDARTGLDDKKVPKVYLGRTSERALEKVRLEDLKGFAVDGEGKGSGSN